MGENSDKPKTTESKLTLRSKPSEISQELPPSNIETSLDYLVLYNQGEKTKAYKTALSDLNVNIIDPTLTDNDISQLMNNTMYLSLCENISDHYLEFNKIHNGRVKSMIDSPDLINDKDLMYYNYSLLNFFVAVKNDTTFDIESFFKYFKHMEKDHNEALLSGLVVDLIDDNKESRFIEFKLVEIKRISLSTAFLFSLLAFSTDLSTSKYLDREYLTSQLKFLGEGKISLLVRNIHN